MHSHRYETNSKNASCEFSKNYNETKCNVDNELAKSNATDYPETRYEKIKIIYWTLFAWNKMTQKER